MSRHLSRKTVIGGLVAAGVLGVGIAVPAFAVAGDPSPSPSASASASGSTEPGDHRQEFAEALAKELGVPVEKVTAALDKVRGQHRPEGRPGRGDDADRQARLKERLDQAVADGKLTRAEADAVLKAVESGVLGGGGRPWHHR
jgi:multidrug efflux pump subunit AcrA (membrane-fusion protein)